MNKVPATKTAQAGTTAVVGIMGLAWMGDTFIAHNREIVIGGLSGMAQAYPMLFALGLFLASVLLYSQAATARALMPLGLQLGLKGPAPDRHVPGGQRLLPPAELRDHHRRHQLRPERDHRHRQYVLNHSFMIPGMVATWSAVIIGLIISRVFF